MAADRATTAATTTPAGSGVGAGRNRIGMELVFRGTEDHAFHRAGERAIAARRGIGERDLHGMVVILVLVDQHHRPLSIGPFDGICGHQDVAVLVLHVARDPEELVNGIDGLHPLLGDHLRRQVLRRVVSNAIVFVDREEIRRPGPPAM